MKRILLFSILCVCLLVACRHQEFVSTSTVVEKEIVFDSVILEKYHFYDNINDTIIVKDSIVVLKSSVHRDSLFFRDTVVLQATEHTESIREKEHSVFGYIGWLLLALILFVLWRKG